MKHIKRIIAAILISYSIAAGLAIVGVMIVNAACSEKAYLKKSVGQRR